MSRLYRKRWLRLATGALVMAVLGAVVTLAGTGGLASTSTDEGRRVAFAYSSSVGESENLPASVEQAVASGWQGSIRCVKGQGRFYRRLQGEQADPLMLLFSADGRLIGLNLHSAGEQPAPWGHYPDGLQAGVEGREAAYWDLNIYLANPLKACNTKSSVYSETW